MSVIRLCILLLIPIAGYSQFNLQTGYDYGFFTFPNYKNNNINILHRINLVSEYIFDNNILVSFNSGIDIHNIDYNFSYRLNNPNNINSSENFFSYKSIVQNYRLGISIGYQFHINTRSKLQIKCSYDQYLVNKISVEEGYTTTDFYDVLVNEIDNQEPIRSTKTFYSLISTEDTGFRNNLIKENRNIIFSLKYTYMLNDYLFILPSVSFSPWNNGLILTGRQNIFLFGINLGYTFHSK